MKTKFSLFFIFFLCSLIFAAERVTVPIDASPQKGPKDALVTIIEFLDFQ